MGFFRTINKTKGFFNKSINNASGFANKVSHVANKGLHIVGDIANVANDVAGKLTNVPVIGGLAGEIRPLLGGVQNAISKGETGLNKFNKINNKFGKMRIK